MRVLPPVIERASAPRKTGGHAVDLFRPAMQAVTKVGLLDDVRAKATGTDRLVIHREGAKPVTVDLRKVYTAVSDNHVEIMRDDLSEIFYNATRRDVEYVFADSITSISADGDVTFERAAPRRFDVIVGADGLHSNVRALTFGPESQFSAWIGAYLSVVSVPNYLSLDGVMETVGEVGRIVIRMCMRRSCCCAGILATWAGKSPGYLPSSTTPRRSISTRSPSCVLTPGRAVGSRWSAMLLPWSGCRRQHQPGGRRRIHTGRRTCRACSGPRCRIRRIRARDRRLCTA